MSDLFGNHIVGFTTRRLISENINQKVSLVDLVDRWKVKRGQQPETDKQNIVLQSRYVATSKR